MPSDTRVVFLTDIITPYMAAVMEALAKRVELTALFCARSGTRAAEWGFEEGLPFRHEVVGGLTIRRPNPDATDFYPSPRILRALVRHRPQAVISSAFSFPSAYAAIYGRIYSARLVVHSDGTSASEQGFGLAQRAARGVVLRAAAACVANSKPARDRFIELGANPVRVFSAPHTTKMAPFWDVAARRTRRPTPAPGTLRVLAVGRLIPRKGVDRLLQAVALAHADEPGIRLSIVGSGPDEAALRSLARDLGIADVVEFAGFVDQPGLPAVYERADAFAFPTLDDPFGIVLLEAAASGLPLVASMRGGATLDLLGDGDAGFVVDPAAPRDTATALVRLARDPALRARMGAAAHAATLERTPAVAADGYARAVAYALESSGSALADPVPAAGR